MIGEDLIHMQQEIEKEVNLLAIQGESLTFQERVAALSSTIQTALSSTNINFNPHSASRVDEGVTHCFLCEEASPCSSHS